MRGNGIRHTTSSTGTGNLTLMAVSGRPSYASVFGGSGSRPVEYTILDDSNVPIEGGVGSVDLSTLVLTRSPVWTWDGTTYDDTSPAPVNVAAGATVICAPMAADAAAHVSIVCDTMGDGLPAVGNDAFAGYASVNIALAQGYLYLHPFVWRGARSVKSAAVRCVTAVAGAKLFAGIYQLTDHQTAQLLVDITNGATGYFDGSTTGTKQHTTGGAGNTLLNEFYLPPGVYLQGCLQTGGSAAWIAANRSASGVAAILGMNNGIPIGQAAVGGGAYASLPASVTLGTASLQDMYSAGPLGLYLGW